MRTPALALLGLLSARICLAQGAGGDPYLWLEDVDGARALEWVRAQDAVSKRELEASPDFRAIHDRLLAIYDSRERIPYVEKRGDYYYNFWQDAQHVRGIWRRTSPAEYRKKDPSWEAVLDLDALAAQEKENWVWKGAQVRYPDYARALVRLSRGGGDAVVVREFDLGAKAFVRGRIRAVRGEERGGLARPRQRLLRHRLRPGLDDRLGLPAHRQALDAGGAARQGGGRLRGREGGRELAGVRVRTSRASTGSSSCARSRPSPPRTSSSTAPGRSGSSCRPTRSSASSTTRR